MKRVISFLLIVFASLLLVGCHSDIEANLSTLERRLTNLVNKTGDVNVNVVQLQSLFNKLEKYDFVQNVKRDYTYDVPTYVITFTHSDPVVLRCGTDAETPVIGVAYDTDGKAYWTVKYSNGTTDFIYNEFGQKVLVTAVTPLVRINNGKWEVSYNDGEVWKSLGTDATGASGTSFVESVEEEEGYVNIKLVSGDVLSFPLQDTYDKLQQDVEAVNNNIMALTEVVNKMKASYIYVKDFSPILKGQDTVGFKLNMSDKSSFSFYHGTSTNKPAILAKKDSSNPADSALYWAIKYYDSTEYEWIYSEDSTKVRADGNPAVYPILRIAQNTSGGRYYWQVSYNGGKSFGWILRQDGTLTMLSANPEPNDAGITSLTHSGGYYLLKVFGETYKIPDSPLWSVKFGISEPLATADDMVINMGASDTVSVKYKISEIGTAPEIASYAQDGFNSWIEKNKLGSGFDNFNGAIKIISPSTFTADSTFVKVIVTNGDGRIDNYSLKVKYQEN